jgi:LVIVD repeat
MRKLAIVLAAAVALAFGAVGLSAGSGDDELFPNEQNFKSKTYEKGAKSGSALNMVAVGHNELSARGFNGDVFVHNDVAYIGRWGFFDSSHPQYCPLDGVAVVDAGDPANPKKVAELTVPGASHEDVVAYTARFGPLAGRDIAAVGLQVCDVSRADPAAAGKRGLALWDVTDPAAPQLLSVFDTGCCTRGFHELEVGDRDDLGRTFVYASLPFGERLEADGVTLRDRQGRGEAWIVDVTDPTRPVLASTFGIRKDLGLNPDAIGQGCFASTFGHGMDPSEDGKLLFVSYWDVGFLTLDTSNPSQPRFLGRFAYPTNADGDAHSTSNDDRRDLLFAADEDFCSNSGPDIEKGWGYLRVLDVSNPTAPKQIGEFRTQNALGIGDPAAGDFTIHNPLVVGNDVYISWYTDGVRVVNTKDPRNPKEVAFFVPPASQQPIKPSKRFVLTNTTQVWGVAYDASTRLVYASDMNSGLWILRRTN